MLYPKGQERLDHSHQEFKGNCMYFRILIFPCKLKIVNDMVNTTEKYEEKGDRRRRRNIIMFPPPPPPPPPPWVDLSHEL
jgi:hypothetical protein